MTEEEKSIIEALRNAIIELQKQIDACSNLLIWTSIDNASISENKSELEAIRDEKITEYNSYYEA